MENNALISIKTFQEMDGEQDVIELETAGKYAQRGGKYYIIYEESELTGFDGTTTTIKVGPGAVTVTRKGKYNMKMDYKQGEKNLCLYQTPYGSIAAAINTEAIAYDLSADGGDLKIDYILDHDNQNFLKNSLNVRIKADHE